MCNALEIAHQQDAELPTATDLIWRSDAESYAPVPGSLLKPRLRGVGLYTPYIAGRGLLDRSVGGAQLLRRSVGCAVVDVGLVERQSDLPVCTLWSCSIFWMVVRRRQEYVHPAGPRIAFSASNEGGYETSSRLTLSPIRCVCRPDYELAGLSLQFQDGMPDTVICGSMNDTLRCCGPRNVHRTLPVSYIGRVHLRGQSCALHAGELHLLSSPAGGRNTAGAK